MSERGDVPVWLRRALMGHNDRSNYDYDIDLLKSIVFPKGVPISPRAIARGIVRYMNDERPRSYTRTRLNRIRDLALIYGKNQVGEPVPLTPSARRGEATPRWLVRLLSYNETCALRETIAKICEHIDGNVVPMTVTKHILPRLEASPSEDVQEAAKALRELLEIKYGDAPGMSPDDRLYLVVDATKGVVSVHRDAKTAFDDAMRWCRSNYAETDLSAVEAVEVRSVEFGERLV